MFKAVGEQAPATRKLVLGFDAGCGTCSDLAGRVQERIGDRLSVENLNDTRLMSWREETLGKDTRWAPTLFEVDGEKVVRAWTGWKLGFALSRRLGPSSTWQVMQALGEVDTAPRIEESSVVEKLPERAAEAVAGMSRGQFLKGVGGAVAAVSILAGAGPLASQVEARTRGPYDVVRIAHVVETRANRLIQRAKFNVDTRVALRGNLSLLEGGRKPEVRRLTLRNGSVLYVTMFYLPNNAVLTNTVISHAIRNRATSVSKLWKPTSANGKKQMVIVRASEGGVPWKVSTSSRLRTTSNTGVVPLGDCPPVGGGSGGGSEGHWCSIKTDQCITYGPTLKGQCPEDVAVAASGCGTTVTVAAMGAAAGTLGVGGLVVGALGAIGCAGGTALAFMNCCREYRYVTVWCRG